MALLAQYCELSPGETLCSFNQDYSMMPLAKLLEYLYQMATGENQMGSKRRERGREKESNGLTIGNDHWEKGHLSISNRSDE